MKTYPLIIMIVITALLDCLGQDALFQGNITVKAAWTEDAVRVLWTPADIDLFDKGRYKGYTLKRYTLEQDGTEIPLSEISGTEVVLAEELLPLPAGDPNWEGEYGKAADQIIYYTNEDLNIQDPNLADAFTYQQENIERFQFGMFVSFLDFNVAQQMALAYHDRSADPNSMYLYKIIFNETNDSDVVRVSTRYPTDFPEIVDVEGESENGKNKIRWPIRDLVDDYFSFNILRSTDNSNFRKINTEPYVYFQSGDAEPTVYEYQDKTMEYGKTYYYAVEGITVFGVTGKPSTSIEIISKPEMINVAPVVKTDDSSEGKVVLNWVMPSQDEDVNDFVAGYHVYRSGNAKGGFELLTPQPIQGKEFVDYAPLTSAYYIVATVDKSDTEYQSLPKFAQIKDMVPPAIPFDLTVRVSSKNQYELEWMANEEEDLEGYLIYTRYAGSENYVMITKDILKETRFIFNYPPDLVADEICFKITAMDKRGNQSEMSECVTVVLPDNLPPATPIMSKHQAVESGIALGWKFSTSDDIAYHTIERKRTGAPEWEVILHITPEQEADYETNVTPGAAVPGCYIDDTFEEQRSYDYRIVAIDDSENKAYSSIVSVIPINDRVAGQIENFTVSAVNTIQVGALPQQDAYDIITAALIDIQSGTLVPASTFDLLVIYRIMTADELASYSTMTLREAYAFLDNIKATYWSSSLFVTLSWEYGNLDQLLYFQIYRSDNGRGFVEYIDISPDSEVTQYIYDDAFIKADHHYVYKVIAVHAGGNFSEISDPILVRVQ